MKNPLFGLQNKVILVVGGGGLGNEGIGASSSLMLAEAGARVMVADRSEERGRDMAALIGERGGEAQSIMVDATDQAEIQRMIDTTIDRFGALDGLITIIGGGRFGPSVDYTEE